MTSTPYNQFLTYNPPANYLFIYSTDILLIATYKLLLKASNPGPKSSSVPFYLTLNPNLCHYTQIQAPYPSHSLRYTLGQTKVTYQLPLVFQINVTGCTATYALNTAVALDFLTFNESSKELSIYTKNNSWVGAYSLSYEGTLDYNG